MQITVLPWKVQLWTRVAMEVGIGGHSVGMEGGVADHSVWVMCTCISSELSKCANEQNSTRCAEKKAESQHNSDKSGNEAK